MRGFTAITSSIVLLLTIALYVRSFSARDQLQFQLGDSVCIIATFPHHLHVLSYYPKRGGVGTRLEVGLSQYPSTPKYMRLRFDIESLSIPFWMIALFAATGPIWWVCRFVVERRRTASDACPQCGYDLRASPERCPECGREREPSPTTAQPVT